MTEAVLAPEVTHPRRTAGGTAPVAVLGSGRLHAAITAALARTHQNPVTGGLTAARGCAAMVVASDTADESPYPAVGRYAARHRIPWLPVRVDSGWMLVGPAVRPPAPLCPRCVMRRRDANRPDAAGRRALRERSGAEPAARSRPPLPPVLATAVAALVAAEVAALRNDPGAARTGGALLRIAVSDGTIRQHPVLADPLCPECSRLPSDGAWAGQLELGPAPKPDPGTFRLRRLADRRQELERTYVDAETGVVQSLATASRGGVAVAVARLAPAVATHGSHHGHGRTGDFASAQLTALAEALERIAGIRPRGRRTAVRAAYAEVADHALDPRSLGLYPDDDYRQLGRWFRRFDPLEQIPWVWGYSFARAAPVLVPESYAHYGSPSEAAPVFVFESSNGCALGSNLTEAIFYGLLEVAERDAFLLAWYARLPLDRVDLATATDRRIPLVAEQIRHRLGYEVQAYDATAEQAVPCFWAMAVDAVGGPDRPAVVCGAAAHPDPERALRATVLELGPAIDGLRQRYDPATAARLLDEADQVQEMDDHAMLYGHPEAYGRLSFLRPDGPTRSLADISARCAWPSHDDLACDLTELVGRYLAAGLDVIAVDTTAAEHRAGGFASAKVIVPGTVPMTFGHRFRRVHNLPRLLTGPRVLGYRTTDLRPDQLNPHPHPFP
jgi:ribosomal protein S12 methylthiotransferase accessory factor